MPALGAGIHVFLLVLQLKKDVDGRDKPGHDAGTFILDCALSALAASQGP
jgi:hypothetical protein